jgi:SAM-dependent methyltransferase
MLRKILGPDKEGREAMYYADRQDFAYQHGAYDYLRSIAMVPRMGAIAAYVKAFGLKTVLDIGCGTGDLLSYLEAHVTYVGIDIAPTAVRLAKERFAGRCNACFYTGDFRRWECPMRDIDGVIWAGIGCAWTRQGRGGNVRDWLEILTVAERLLTRDGYLICELVSTHWPALEKLIAGHYVYEAGCDIHCFQSVESPKRSIRVLKKMPHTTLSTT